MKEQMDFRYPVNQRSDIYSLGCLFYYMVTGISPKDCEKINDNHPLSKKGKQVFDKCTISYELRYKNVKALQKSILKALHHPKTPLEKLLLRIPGLGSQKNFHKIISVLFYVFMFFCFMGKLSNGYNKGDVSSFIYVFLLFFILLDIPEVMLALKKRFPYFQHHKISYIILGIVVRIVLIVWISVSLLE